jgi:primosomal protein N' (replication factor Y)
MSGALQVIRVAINTPLNQLFDYLPPAKASGAQPGQRVRVPFGRREQIGVIVELDDQSEVPANKLRTAVELLDGDALLDEELMRLLAWSSTYYQHPPGEVISAALPAGLRKGAPPTLPRQFTWRATEAGRAADIATLARKASVQARILSLLIAKDSMPEAALREAHSNWRKIVSALQEKGWAECHETVADDSGPGIAGDTPPTLTQAQQQAIDNIPDSGFAPCLLEGVTGSGKTEVYLQLIQRQIAEGRQTLVLVPEIGLTPQLVDRFRRRIGDAVAVMHSGLTDAQRLNAWLAARDNRAKVIIGTRSAIFTPLAKPGLIVIDEEHDASFKQQDGFRYSARDLAVWRARQLKIPVVLGSATPAFESLHNALEKRYRHLLLPERPGSARQPDTHVIDLRQHALHEGLSQPLIQAMRRHLDAGGQALIYLNRRGFAPTLLCPACGITEECRRCDARMVLHQRSGKLVCHHCGSERRAISVCTECHTELIPVGQGTERLEQQLRKTFPEYSLVRIDRDTTRRRGELERLLEEVRSKDARILLGTQMLTKGHDFPDVTMVGIIDSDQGLFGTDFRSSERLAQSILQVSGRAGRGDRPGEVWIQTWYPDHPLLTTLLNGGYDRFADEALAERRKAAWPPFSFLALLRAEHSARVEVFEFLEQARSLAEGLATAGIQILGPASSPMEKRSGRYRGQLLIQAANRAELQHFLAGWRAAVSKLREARRSRWSLDIDPVELF